MVFDKELVKEKQKGMGIVVEFVGKGKCLLNESIKALENNGFKVELEEYTLDGIKVKAIEQIYKDGKPIRLDLDKTGFLIEEITETVSEPSKNGRFLCAEEAIAKEGVEYRVIVVHEGVYRR